VKLSELVSKGVRLIVTDTEEDVPPQRTDAPRPAPPQPTEPTAGPPRRGGPPPRTREIPPEVAEAEPPRQVARSEVAADVEDFGAVYEEAGIELPLHGYGIDKVSEMLQNKRLASLNREVRASAVLAALEAASVDVEDVIQDGVRRDKALDAFEAAKERALVELRERNESRIKVLRGEMEELLRKINAEVEALKAEAETAAQAFAGLQIRKRREEQRLYEVVDQLRPEANPITTGTGRAAPPKPAGDA
jgi:hypothetical protein